jgi:hypothetical protein
LAQDADHVDEQQKVDQGSVANVYANYRLQKIKIKNGER